MVLLLLGLVLFTILHLIPFWGRSVRSGAISLIGAGQYKILFALATFGSFVLMVTGWKATVVAVLYDTPAWTMHVTPIFVLVGFILFIASNAPTNIRRALRHPQLLGVMLWGVGHLISNGENRSVLLFSGMIIFSFLAMLASNRRDGEWVKRDKVPFSRDIVTVSIALILYGAFAYFHGWIIGVPVM